jgi:hypothetical protein
MTSWEQRPRLLAHFLNPALLALVIGACAAGYERARHEPIPWVLLFVAAPLVLHGPSRRALPRDTRTHFSTWIARNPDVLAGFPERVRGIAPRVREGLRYGIRYGVLSIENELVHSSFAPPSAPDRLDDLVRTARLIGRWLAKLDRPSTAYALLRVTP